MSVNPYKELNIYTVCKLFRICHYSCFQNLSNYRFKWTQSDLNDSLSLSQMFDIQDQYVNEYRGKYKYERAPHMYIRVFFSFRKRSVPYQQETDADLYCSYALANDAYRFMLQNLHNQCVIIR